MIYVSSMDAAAHDLEKNSNVSFSFSEAQGDWCRNHDVDPEDPRCAKVHLFGKVFFTSASWALLYKAVYLYIYIKLYITHV